MPIFCFFILKRREGLKLMENQPNCTYLDNSATTPVCPEAAQKAYAMMTEHFGNPSSLHTLGFEAEEALDDARKQAASLIGAPPQTLVFTSGGTEANNLAILGGAAAQKRAGRHLITTTVEHPSVSACFDELEKQGYEVTRLNPLPSGCISVGQVESVCRPDTILVSLMMVNNETGARFPVEEIAESVHRLSPHALFHCDAVQAAGKLPIAVTRFPTDLLTISSHKIHGPKGSGGLYIRKGARILPRNLGGGQEKGLRSGTEAMPLIAAFGAAAAAVPPYKQQTAHFEALYKQLAEGLQGIDGVVLHRPEKAVPYIINLSVPGIRSETMLHFLAARQIYVSSGSACSKGAKSPILTALGYPQREIDSALRISLSRYNTADDIDRFLQGLQAAVHSLIRL